MRLGRRKKAPRRGLKLYQLPAAMKSAVATAVGPLARAKKIAGEGK